MKNLQDEKPMRNPWETGVMKGEWGGKGFWYGNGEWRGQGEWRDEKGRICGIWKGRGGWEKRNEHQGVMEGRGELKSGSIPTISNVIILYITIVGVVASVIGLLTGLVGWIGALIIFMLIMMLLVGILPVIKKMMGGSWGATGNWTDNQGVRTLEVSGEWRLGLVSGTLSGTMRDKIE